MTRVVLTVGNDLRADDGAGPLLAELLEQAPAAGWHVVDGGSAPENRLHQVRELRPAAVLIVDAADLGLAPGALRRIPEDCVAQHFLITTHAIPLNYLIASLRESVDDIVFLGIQPRELGFFEPMTPAVRHAVERLHQMLVEGRGIDGIPFAGAEAVAN